MQRVPPMKALILDNDGCTVVISKRYLKLFEEAGFLPYLDVSPYTWRAFELNLGQKVAEIPGIVNHFAKLMAEENISILHQSTYGSGMLLSRVKKCRHLASNIKRGAFFT